MGNVGKWPPDDATRGENLIAELIESKGSSDLRSYHNITIDNEEIDVVILDRGSGDIYVLEIKDWHDHWHPVDDETWVSDRDKFSDKDPFHKARNKSYKVKERLSSSKQFVEAGGKHAGKLIFPVHSASVFESLCKKDLLDYKHHAFFSRSLFADDLVEDQLGKGEFDRLLDNVRDPRLKSYRRKRLTDEQLDEVAALLTNRVRGRLKVDEPQVWSIESPIVNRYLEIRGHAGTGKSVVLLERARRIVGEYPSWKVLVLSRNIAMRHLLELEWERMGVETNAKISFRDFNTWSGELEASENGVEEDVSLDSADAVKVLGKADYEAVLVDEGQDFDERMLRAVRAHLNSSPKANSFTICRDPWQDIYGADVGRDLPNVMEHTFEEIVVLDRKYRCIVDIAQFARLFVLTANGKRPHDHALVRALFKQEFVDSFPKRVSENLGKFWRFLNTDVGKLGDAARKLEPVSLVEASNPKDAILQSLKEIRSLREKARIKGEGDIVRIAIVYSDMKCLGGQKAGNEIDELMETEEIRRYYIATRRSAGDRDHISPVNGAKIKEILSDREPHVVIANVWQLKGLEADAVIFVGADSPGLDRCQNPESVVYVGLTRGRVLLRLIVSHDTQRRHELMRAYETYSDLRAKSM